MVKIKIKTLGIDEDGDITYVNRETIDNEKEATAWANYFVSLTRTESTCLAGDDATKLEGLKQVWGELQTEYNAMVSGAKDEFCTNEDLQEVLKHYQFIISKFGKTNLTDFVKDGSGNSPALASQNLLNLLPINEIDITTIVLISFVALGTISVGIFFISKRRKEQ